MGNINKPSEHLYFRWMNSVLRNVDVSELAEHYNRHLVSPMRR